MTAVLFLAGLFAGATLLAVLLVPRLRGAMGAARAAEQNERTARIELKAASARHRAELAAVGARAAHDAEHAERLAREREDSHQRQLDELRAVTAEKIALVSGNREQLAAELKSLSADTLREVSKQFEQLAIAQRETDRAIAAGELEKRTQEIKRSLDPIQEQIKRVGDQVVRLENDRQATHGQVRQLFESMTAEVGRLRDQTGSLVSALKRPQVRGAWGEMQLRNCVTAANMTEHVDFVAQASVLATDGTRLRPDLVA